MELSGERGVDDDISCQQRHWNEVFLRERGNRRPRVALRPPFRVVDITLRQQPYEGDMRKHIPDWVVAEDTEETRGTADDILDSDTRELLSLRGVKPAHYLKVWDPRLPSFLEAFPAHIVRAGETTLKFVTVAVSAPDLPLEEITNMKFSGRPAGQVYRELVLPRLAQVRGG